MRDNPYKDLSSLERRPDGSLYRMTSAQRKQAASCAYSWTSPPDQIGKSYRNLCYRDNYC